MESDQIIALIALTISLISFLLSWVSYKNSNLQFQITNQSYLQADMTQNGITIPNNDRNIRGVTASEDLQIQGLNCSTELTNIGNIPLKYTVTRYDIYINGQLKNNIDLLQDNNQGILYPKQVLSFYMKTTPFGENGSTIKYADIKRAEIIAFVTIEYNDLNSSHKKVIDRKIKLLFHDNVIGTRYLEFNDKI